MIIQDDQVKDEPFQSQVFVSAKELTDHSQVALFLDAHERDRQIAAYTIGPQGRLIPGVELENVRARPQRRVRIKQSSGEPLKQVRLVRIDLQVAHFDLSLRPCQARFSLERIWVVVFVREPERFLTRTRQARSKGDAG